MHFSACLFCCLRCRRQVIILTCLYFLFIFSTLMLSEETRFALLLMHMTFLTAGNVQMEPCEGNGRGQILLVFGLSIPLFGCHHFYSSNANRDVLLLTLESILFLLSVKTTIYNQSGNQERGHPTLHVQREKCTGLCTCRSRN